MAKQTILKKQIFKEKDGQPIIRNVRGENKVIWNMRIQTNITGENWAYATLWGQDKSPEYKLEEGKEYDLIIEKKDYNGKEFVNFSLPKRNLYSELDDLKRRVEALEGKKVEKLPSFDIQQEGEEVAPDSLPF